MIEALAGLDERYVHDYEPGEYVFREGDDAHLLHIVLSGSVRIWSESHPDASLATVHAGDMFGEMALIESAPRSAHAEVTAKSTIIGIDQARFVYLLSHDPSFALTVLQTLSERLRDSFGLRKSGPLLGVDAEAMLSAPVRVNEMAPGFWQIVMPKLSAHTYVIKGRDRIILVDSGLPGTRPHLELSMASFGLRVSDIDLALLTHEHVDHVGGASSLDPRTLIGAHRSTADKVALQDDYDILSQKFSQDAPSFKVDLMLENGSAVQAGGYVLEAIHTPGHTSSCMSYYEPTTQILLTGDVVFAGGYMGGIFGSGSMAEYIASLRHLQSLRVVQFGAGHGRISTNPYDDFTTAMGYAKRWMNDSRLLSSSIASKKSFEQFLQGAFGLGK
jgi:hydroxyacylglutathione hydrolase